MERLKEIDFSKLIVLCQCYIDKIENGEGAGSDSDWDVYIKEEALEAIFGEKVFTWINERTA